MPIGADEETEQFTEAFEAAVDASPARRGVRPVSPSRWFRQADSKQAASRAARGVWKQAVR